MKPDRLTDEKRLFRSIYGTARITSCTGGIRCVLFGRHRFGVLLPDLFAIHRTAVVCTKRNQAAVRCCIVDTAPLNTIGVVVEAVHEVHGSDKQGILVELTDTVVVVFDQGIVDHLVHIDLNTLDLSLLHNFSHVVNTGNHSKVSAGLPCTPELLCHLGNFAQELIHINETIDRDNVTFFIDKTIGCSTAVRVGAEHNLCFTGVRLDQITDGHHGRYRVEVSPP